MLRCLQQRSNREKTPFPHFFMHPVQGRRKHQVRGHDVWKGTLQPLLIEMTPQRILKFLVQRQLVMAVEKPGAAHQEKLCNGIPCLLQYPLCPPVPTSLISLNNFLHFRQRHLTRILIVFLQKASELAHCLISPAHFCEAINIFTLIIIKIIIIYEYFNRIAYK